MIRILLLSAFLCVGFILKAQPTLEHKVGQMLMVGFQGTEIDTNHHIVKDIVEYKLGGIIIYEYDLINKSRPRNIASKEQLAKLIKDLESYSQTPLFIGVDEEGGRVSRLKTSYGFLPTASAEHLGEIDNVDSTKYYAKRIAEACKSMGININFAPSVDVNVNPDCPVIGGIERSFSADTINVVKHAEVFIHEHAKKDIFCSIKHFPGHGSAEHDSHLGFTDVSSTWSAHELYPFKKIIEDDDRIMVMTSHVFNSNIDAKYPATLSKPTLDLLREGMDFDGLILSDDMMMRAIQSHYGWDESIAMAINAGVDVLLFSNNIERYNKSVAERVIKTIVRLVNSGTIPMERIDESYARIMKYKAEL